MPCISEYKKKKSSKLESSTFYIALYVALNKTSTIWPEFQWKVNVLQFVSLMLLKLLVMVTECIPLEESHQKISLFKLEAWETIILFQLPTFKEKSSVKKKFYLGSSSCKRNDQVRVLESPLNVQGCSVNEFSTV